MSIGQSTIILSLDEKRTLFALIALSRTLWYRATEVLPSSNFPESEDIFRFWLECISETRQSLGDMPSMDAFKEIVIAKLEENVDVDEEAANDVDAIWRIASALEGEQDKYYKEAQALLSKYVQMCHRHVLQNSLRKPVDLLSTLNNAQGQLIKDMATDDSLFKSVYLEGLDERPSGRFISVGIDFIDMYCGGGGPGTTDVLGHAGPRGGGKSTLINQVAVNIALNEQEQAAKEERRPKIVYLFNYERVQDPLIHTLSYAGRISRTAIENFIYTKETDHFSRNGDYKDYERRQFKHAIAKAKNNGGQWPLTEMERLALTRKLLATNLEVADFSGQNPHLMKFAGGFVEGAQMYIELHQQSIGNPGVAFVGFDYAGTCVRIHLHSTNKDASKHERQFIEDLPLRAKRVIANKYNTFVWVSHQLAAEEAAKAPGTRPDPNKFKSCKSFAENCDYTIVNGVPTKDGLAVFVQSKARRGDPRPDIVARLRADQCCWESAGLNYVVENDTAMSRDDAQSISGFAVTEQFDD